MTSKGPQGQQAGAAPPGGNGGGDDASATGATVPMPCDPGVDGDEGGEGEAQLLVSEFPPPPYYYRIASQKTFDDEEFGLKPPPIPSESFVVAARKIRRMAEAAAAEMEKARLEAMGMSSSESEPRSEGAVNPANSAPTDGSTGIAKDLGGSAEENAGTGMGSTDDDDEGQMVAVFGEIVEDPMLAHVPHDCENPKVVRDQLERLNRDVVQGFVKLVNDLVYRPLDNKKRRDELSHNLFLMIQEANKFREHQAREILINILEEQLSERRKRRDAIRKEIAAADKALEKIRFLGGEKIDEG